MLTCFSICLSCFTSLLVTEILKQAQDDRKNLFYFFKLWSYKFNLTFWTDMFFS